MNDLLQVLDERGFIHQTTDKEPLENLLDSKELEEAMKDGMLENCARVVGRTVRRTAELILRERPFEAIGSRNSG